MVSPTSQARQHIAQLFQEKAKCKSNDTDLANTLERDISTAFKGEQKYIFEMLQNADDAGIEQDKISVSFQVVNDAGGKYLIISHTGSHFTATDVDKITSNAQQYYKDKTSNQEVIGYKGVGFKAIFSISDCVYILSKGYQFRFDKQFPQWDTQDARRRYPWPVIPIWTEDHEIPEAARKACDRMRVNFILKLKENTNIEKDLDLFASRPEIMLFLRRVKDISVVAKTQRVFKLCQGQLGENLYENDRLKGIWKKHAVDIQIDSKMSQLLEGMDSHVCPERLKSAKKTTLIFAMNLNMNSEIIPADRSVLYTYLPTQVYMGGVPFIVNGDFLLDPARTQLQDNSWNEWLIQNVAQEQFRWFASLNLDDQLRFQILKLFKVSPFIATQKFTDIFERGFQKGKREVAFLPSFQNPRRLLRVGEAHYDETGFFHEFNDVAPHVQLLDYRLANYHVLQLARNITAQGLCAKLPSLIATHASPEFQLRLFQFFKAHAQMFRHYLPNTPCVLDASNRFRLPQEIYFPTKDIKNIPQEVSITFVHPELSENADFKQWALQQGAHQTDARDIILVKVAQLIAKGQVNAKNVLAITRFIFDAFKGRKLRRNELVQLQDLPILTTLGTTKPSRDVYLSDVYKPNLPLQQVLLGGQGAFVSEAYNTDEAELDNWKDFFLLLGVQQDIAFTNRPFYSLQEGSGEKGALFIKYITYLRSKGMAAQGWNNNHTLSNFLDCNILTHLKSVGIAKEFWTRLLQRFNEIKNPPTMQYVMANGRKLNITESYIEYLIQNVQCVPASDGSLRLPSEVFYQSSGASNLLCVDLPVALTKEQAEHFKFKTSLSSGECVSCLLGLNQRKSKDPNAYAEILKILLELPRNEVQRAVQRKDIQLPNQGGGLEFASKLRCYAISNKAMPLFSDTKQWLKELPGMSREELIQISLLLGIRVITEKDREFGCVKPLKEDPEGKLHILSRLPLIARVEALATGSEEAAFLGKFKGKLEPVAFKTTNRMSFTYKGLIGPDNLIFAHMEMGTIYSRHRWDHESTIHDFCKMLAGFLELSKQTAKRLPGILKAESAEEWIRDHELEEKGLLDLDSVPSSQEDFVPDLEEDSPPVTLPKPVKVATEPASSPITPPETPGTPERKLRYLPEKTLSVKPDQLNFSDIIVKKAQFPPKDISQGGFGFKEGPLKQEDPLFIPPLKKKESIVTITPPTQDIGYWGEGAVFGWLKHYYRKEPKYSGGSYEETKYSFKLTKPAPTLFNLEVTWINGPGESKKPYDITVIEDGVKKVIEVKATLSENKSEFTMGHREFQKMLKYKKRYEFFRVYGAGTDRPRIDFVRNPAKKLELNKLKIKAFTIQL